MTQKSLNVVKDEKEPEADDILAKAILKIGDAADRLRKSGLNERAIIVLLHHETKVPMGSIKTVLRGLTQLKTWYCR